MSWPSAVVPSRWPSWPGGMAGAKASRFGSRTEVNSCGTTAKIRKITKMIRPVSAFGLRRRLRSAPPLRRLVGAGSATAAVVSSAVTGSPLGPGARVEPRRGEVADQYRDQHRDREEHEQHLHQRVVGVADRVVEQVAQARIVEDVLDEDRAGDEESECHREAGRVG